MKILYSSNDVHVAISKILSNPKSTDKRKILVAYIGGKAESFLPDPEALEIVCCLKAGATDALTLARLEDRKAKIFKSNRLHMKVYWSSRNGCVITSANASGSALGSVSQKEAGVWLPSRQVNISKLWKYAKPTRIRPADLRLLNKKADRLPVNAWQEPPSSEMPDFIEWWEKPLSTWKLGWWDNHDPGFAPESLETAKARFGVVKPYTYLNCAASQLKAHDWALSFDLPAASSISWMYVDFRVRLNRSYRGFDSAYPYQAVQARRSSECPRPPFKLDNEFRKAFRRAVRAFGPEKIEQNIALKPSNKFLQMIARAIRPEGGNSRRT